MHANPGQCTSRPKDRAAAGFVAHKPTAAEDGSLRSMTAGTATDALCSAANPRLAITRINMSPLAEKSTRRAAPPLSA
jgi:hypothetical protein